MEGKSPDAAAGGAEAAAGGADLQDDGDGANAERLGNGRWDFCLNTESAAGFK